jgi:hypothetical protein
VLLTSKSGDNLAAYLILHEEYRQLLDKLNNSAGVGGRRRFCSLLTAAWLVKVSRWMSRTTLRVRARRNGTASLSRSRGGPLGIDGGDTQDHPKSRVWRATPGTPHDAIMRGDTQSPSRERRVLAASESVDPVDAAVKPANNLFNS